MTFRRNLVLRLFAIAATAMAIPTIGVALSACGTCPDTPNTPVDTTTCFAAPGGTGGNGGMGGAGGAGGAGGGGAMVCPSKTDAKATFDANGSGVIEVVGDGVIEGGNCCYLTKNQPEIGCVGGRPFLVDDTLVVAPLVYGQRDGRAFAHTTGSPDISALSADERAALAAAWSRDGLLEHASIASFGRFALSLLAVGAPAELVQAAHEAAIDEVHHARLCFGLAGAYAGENVEPGAFPFDGNVQVTMNLEELAVRTAQEGCIGETIAACVASEQLATATDPAVRMSLEVIAADEARHAELAFRTVAWAIRVGGAQVRAAVARVFAAMGTQEMAASAVENAVFQAHGRLNGRAERAAMRRALDEVVRPAAMRMLDVTAEAVPHIAASPTNLMA